MKTKAMKKKTMMHKKMITKKMITKKIIVKLVFLILFLAAANAVSAFAIGASPPVASFVLARGGSQETTFQTSTNSESPVAFDIVVDDNIKDFIRVNPQKDQMQLGKPGKITIYASVQRSAKPGNYSGAITVFATPYESAVNGTGSKISTGISVRADIQVLEEKESLLKSPVFLIGAVFCALAVILLCSFYFFKIRK